jgi:hypothetical protein
MTPLVWPIVEFDLFVSLGIEFSLCFIPMTQVGDRSSHSLRIPAQEFDLDSL